MKVLTVIGSGPSGVHAALTALARGYTVRMLDVGKAGPLATDPDATFPEYRRGLADGPAELLGPGYESLILPGSEGEYYGFPPSKSHVFEDEDRLHVRSDGFAPLFSHARGGLAEAWTGGSYPFSAEEIACWPVDHPDLLHWYGVVAERIGMTGTDDDLTPIFPWHRGLSEPVELDPYGQDLLAAYHQRRQRLRRKGVALGQARLAVLRDDRGPRSGCQRLGRCLWGCPRGALWTPSVTLADLMGHPDFEYQVGCSVQSFAVDDGMRATGIVVHRSGRDEVVPVEGPVALAAGTLSSAGILLRTWRRAGRETPELTGLMDNRQVLMPFVQFRRLGRKFESANYQYHQLVLGVTGDGADSYVHGLITTLKTGMIHPLVSSLPFGFRHALQSFRDLHGALGLVNVNFADHRRLGNGVRLEGDVLAVRYQPDSGEPARIRGALKRMKWALRQLGCWAPKAMTHMRPMGASVHYAGLLPMSEEGGPLTATPWGESRAFPNVLLVDGMTFPSLPAKNLTFTLMANASRIVDLATR